MSGIGALLIPAGIAILAALFLAIELWRGQVFVRGKLIGREEDPAHFWILLAQRATWVVTSLVATLAYFGGAPASILVLFIGIPFYCFFVFQESVLTGRSVAIADCTREGDPLGFWLTNGIMMTVSLLFGGVGAFVLMRGTP